MSVSESSFHTTSTPPEARAILDASLTSRIASEPTPHSSWDYLVLTASNEWQAAAYREQLEARRRLNMLHAVDQVLVVADPGGRRIGSGGSTLLCLSEIIRREAIGHADRPEAWLDILSGLRILIVHAGGDSRRLPAYGPCGKAFVPLPCPSHTALAPTLFDRQLPTYLDLPPASGQRGQIVITSGDVLLQFPAREVTFAERGFTGLCCMAPADRAKNHGVYCLNDDHEVNRVLQKPSPEIQAKWSAMNRYGESPLDIGVIGFDAETAVTLLELTGLADASADHVWTGPAADEVLRHGLDFYREVCCALGKDADLDHYRRSVRASGSRWSDESLESMFHLLSPIPIRAEVVPECSFLHFGTTREIVVSGHALLNSETSRHANRDPLVINSVVDGASLSSPRSAWIEACRIQERLTLGGDNAVVGVDVDTPLELAEGVCLDVLPGWSREGEEIAFVRVYRDGDLFNAGHNDTATLGKWPIDQWLTAAEGKECDVWADALPRGDRTAWNARLFPATPSPEGYRHWLWMADPGQASASQFQAWLRAERFSLEEIATRTDQQAFHQRRVRLWSEGVASSVKTRFRATSQFSAEDLGHVLEHVEAPARLVAEVLREAFVASGASAGEPESTRPAAPLAASFSRPAGEAFLDARVLHTLGTAVSQHCSPRGATVGQSLPGLKDEIEPPLAAWLSKLGVLPANEIPVDAWCGRLKESAFQQQRGRIVQVAATTAHREIHPPRPDEIIWGRVPARLDLAGGWTDTPPFSLEHGGAVLNAAVNLNGQTPIQAYARLAPQLRIRLHSIDRGTQLDIHTWDELLDFATATGEFSLAKGALALGGFAEMAGVGHQRPLEGALEQLGGGIELTTLAAIPKGSGLGTSSIMGAVLLAVVHRVLGRQRSTTELFHDVLRLEQVMTTGGGWQDQVGGVVDGVKLVTTEAGLVPQPTIQYVPADVLDPERNGGSTLLYYTGVTRLAKNILQQVVGRYLDRNRVTLATLRDIHQLASAIKAAMAKKDIREFGRLIDCSWRLNKRLDPNSSTDEIEDILRSVRNHIYGAKLLGAGGGGFLFMVCKSPEDACHVRRILDESPPNRLARFFDYAINGDGLAVDVC